MITVRDLLARKNRTVICVTPDDTALEAAKRMTEQHIGAVVVREKSGNIMGIFTERDLMRRVVCEGHSPDKTAVSAVMSSPVSCAGPDTTLDECRSVMTASRLRHLPVVENGELIGIVSSGDIHATETQVQQTTIKYLHEYLHGRT
jgi:CBS domain-containing protein